MDDKLNETLNNDSENNGIDLKKEDVQPEKSDSETPVISLNKDVSEEKAEAPAEENTETKAEEKNEEKTETVSSVENNAENAASESTESAQKQSENVQNSKPNNTNMKKTIQVETVNAGGTKDNNAQEKKKNSIGKKAVLAVAALFVLYIFFSAASSIGKKYARPVKYYYTAIEKSEGKYLEKAFGEVSKEELDKILKENKKKNPNSKVSEIKDASDVYSLSAMSLHKKYMETYGMGFKIKTEVTDKEKISKDEIKKLNEKLKEKSKGHKIKKGYQLESKITIKSKKDNESVEKTEYTKVFLIDGDWVFFNDSGYNMDELLLTAQLYQQFIK